MKHILFSIVVSSGICLPATAQTAGESPAQNFSPEVLKKAAEIEAAERTAKHNVEIEERGKELKRTKYKGWKDYQLMYVADSLENELSRFKSHESEIESNRLQSEQLLKTAEQTNASASELQAQLARKAADADKMAARFCFIRLSQRYKPEWHNEVMQIIPTITTEEVIREYTPTFELLKEYPQYYAEVKDVIKKAYDESIVLRNADGRSAGINREGDRNAFFAKWTNAIKATEYYKKYYNTPHNIYYLNKQIGTFLQLLAKQRTNLTDFYLVAFPEE